MHCSRAMEQRGNSDMKKQGVLNAQLAGYIAGLGHKDLFMVADAGMPIPKGVPLVDLAVCGGVPTFQQVMDAILQETVVEHYTLANEIVSKNPELLVYIQQKLQGVPYDKIPHLQLKELSAKVKFAVRTGEFTPFPNIICRAGVAFSA